MVQHSMKPKSVSMRDLIIILMQTRVPCFEFCQLMFPFALLAVLLFMLESKHLLICKQRKDLEERSSFSNCYCTK